MLLECPLQKHPGDQTHLVLPSPLQPPTNAGFSSLPVPPQPSPAVSHGQRAPVLAQFSMHLTGTIPSGQAWLMVQSQSVSCCSQGKS